MTTEEIRAEAGRRIEQMPSEEYEKKVVQIRADLYLTEHQNLTTLTGEKRQHYMEATARLNGTSLRDPRTMSLRELRDTFGNLPQNTVYGRKPRIMKTWIFVLSLVLAFHVLIILLVLLGNDPQDNIWYAILTIVSILLFLAIPGLIVMIIVSAVHNKALKRRILINSTAAIDEILVQKEINRIMTDAEKERRERIRVIAQMKAEAAAKEKQVAEKQKQETENLQKLEDGKFAYADTERTNTDLLIGGKYPEIKPEPQTAPRFTEEDLNQKLASLKGNSAETYLIDAEGSDLAKRTERSIEEEADARIEALTPSEYEKIAMPIRKYYDEMQELEKAGFGTGWEQSKNLVRYHQASYKSEQLIQQSQESGAYRPILEKYGVSASELSCSNKNLLKDEIRKYALIVAGCVALTVIMALLVNAFADSFTGFENFLLFILFFAAPITGIVFLVRLIRSIVNNAILNRAIDYYGTDKGRERQIKDLLQARVFLKERERFDNRRK